MDTWVERELGDEFPDRRLKARLGKLLGDLGRRIGGTVPAACQDWAAAKAAYRFFSNPRGDEGVILAGHLAATAARFRVAWDEVSMWASDLVHSPNDNFRSCLCHLPGY